jgi:Fic family protein
MGKIELFLHDQPEKTPFLIKAALAHVQFETIHPFLDGNGRLGRLIITLLLCFEKVLKEPMLYLSLYFKTHRQRYYELLNEVRRTGDRESWLDFFCRCRDPYSNSGGGNRSTADETFCRRWATD